MAMPSHVQPCPAKIGDRFSSRSACSPGLPPWCLGVRVDRWIRDFGVGKWHAIAESVCEGFFGGVGEAIGSSRVS